MSYNFSFKTFADGEEISLSYFPHFVTTGSTNSSGGSYETDSLSFNECSQSSENTNQPSVPSDALNKIRSLRRTKQTIYDIARMNDWDYFLTFTISDDNYRYNYSSCKKLVQNWLSNFKQRFCPDLKYLVVSEYHSDGAIHFHGLISGVCKDQLQKSKDPDHQGDFYCIRWHYGRNYFSPIKDRWRVTYYITKYVTKDYISIPGNQRYIRSKGLKIPEKKTAYLEDIDLIEYVTTNFPDYDIVHSYNGKGDSCFLQLKKKNGVP